MIKGRYGKSLDNPNPCVAGASALSVFRYRAHANLATANVVIDTKLFQRV